MIMWTDLVVLMSCRTAARVVVLPEPVAPVTSTSPVFSWASLWKISGIFNCARVGISVLSLRITMENLLRWVNTLTRKRNMFPTL